MEEEREYVRSQFVMERRSFMLAVIPRAGRTSSRRPWLKKEQEGEGASRGPFHLHQQSLFILRTPGSPGRLKASKGHGHICL